MHSIIAGVPTQSVGKKKFQRKKTDFDSDFDYGALLTRKSRTLKPETFSWDFHVKPPWRISPQNTRKEMPVNLSHFSRIFADRGIRGFGGIFVPDSIALHPGCLTT